MRVLERIHPSIWSNDFDSHPAAGMDDSFYRWNLTGSEWTVLTPSGPTPPGRFFTGCAATPDGLVYIFGGDAGQSENRLSFGIRVSWTSPKHKHCTP